ncbi:MAG: hypothetical protein VYA30_03700, partial [Myxococcota bacterium]|nr:hypothetical protein [Myxococcota bacterium]
MSGQIAIYRLARELGKKSTELVKEINASALPLTVKSHMSFVSLSDAENIRGLYKPATKKAAAKAAPKKAAPKKAAPKKAPPNTAAPKKPAPTKDAAKAA